MSLSNRDTQSNYLDIAKVFILSLVSVFIIASSNANSANSTDVKVLNEELGTEQADSNSFQQSITISASAQQTASIQPRLLLIPESINDRVMAFDPISGDLLNADFIPSDSAHLSTPIHAVLSANSRSILVSDQLEDLVLEYDLSGKFVGIFAPKGGVDNDILDNIRGMAMRNNGNLLVTVGSGANSDAIAEFDTQGNYLGNFIARGAGGLDSPFGLLKRGGGFLVGGITSENVLSFSGAGEFQSEFTAIDSFPEQLALAKNGNVLVANFLGDQEGIIELAPDGSAVVSISDPIGLDRYRGIFELPNRNYLVTNGSGVHEIDREGNLIETKISGVSARFIELVDFRGDELCMSIKANNGKVAVICL